MELKDMIKRLCDIRQELVLLEREAEALSSPIISDLEQVETVYGYCVEAHGQLFPNVPLDKPVSRRRILFVILFLFSPKTLAGTKMSRGLRAEISKIMGVESSNVSHYHSTILFFYNVYEDFRGDVNRLFAIVYDKLKRKNK